MKKHSSPIATAKLHKFTDLNPLSSNVTRWSSTVSMLRSYLKHKPILSIVEIDDLAICIPLTQEHEMIEELSSTLDKLDDVTKSIQSDTCTLSDARALLDCDLEEFPSVSNRLSATAQIIHNPEFETVIQKY